MPIVPLAECPQHIDAVTQWLWDEWQGSYAQQTYEQLKQVVIGGPTCPPTLVALDRAATPIGVVVYRRVTLHGREPLRLFLNALFVHETQRGQGVGSALVREAVGRVGPEDNWLYVYTHLRAWYEKLGFVVIEEEAATGNVVLKVAAAAWSD